MSRYSDLGGFTQVSYQLGASEGVFVEWGAHLPYTYLA